VTAPARVVIVDDDEDYRFLVRTALSGDERYAVVADTATGVGAIDLARSEQPDIVLLDVDLPELDGFDVAAAVRDVAPQAMCILLSGYSPDHLAPGQPGLVTGQLSKDLPVVRLGAELGHLVDVLRALDPTVAVVQAEFDEGPTDARSARVFVDDHLTQWGCRSDIDTVKLLVSELVSNASEHAQSAVTITVALLPEIIRVEVTDADDELPHRRVAGDFDLGGRGLAIVEHLAASWGVRRLPKGKRVWFEVRRSEP
jgi:CheY-like chemotaxis protein